MLKSVVRSVGAAVRLSSATTSTARALPLSCPMLRSLSRNSSGYRPKLFSSKVLSPSVSCGCGGLHTEGDKAFGDFLSDEIKEREEDPEKQKLYPRIVLEDGELEMNGTEAKLSRSVSGESKITVTFNINNITKQAAKHSLVFDCHFPEDEMSHGEGEEESDIFAIREVSFQPEGDTEWKETCYTLNTDSLDWALYDHMMDFLADRGVDNTFADELMELSTAIEHQEYIKFLEDLQGFVKCN
uniref:Complement component 1 Q subcomponent-binding protein, mitochondrial n=1 Tax=Amphiprion percula TaxID=161767 RepID=A0A3P8T3Y3_AMPPE